MFEEAPGFVGGKFEGAFVGAGLSVEFSEGVGDAVGRSAVKLFLVVGGNGVSMHTTALWGWVVRSPRVAVVTVKPAVSSNEDGVKRDELLSLWVSVEIPLEQGECSSGGLGFVAPPPRGGGGGLSGA